MRKFNVICHYPTTEKGIQELKDRVSMEHANAVLRYVERNEIPNEILQRAIESVENEMKYE